MKSKKTVVMMMLASFVFMLAVQGSTAQTTQIAKLPNPVLYFLGAEYYSANGKEWVRYRYAVDNSSAYPDSLFAAAPTLPPCGANTNSSRTWVDFFDHHGKRLYGFCALGKASSLNTIWFAVEQDVVPPSWIYIEMTDRQTNTKYKSNLADTVL
jgi:hypothetical protein